MTAIAKCIYYDQKYCKNKDKCTHHHPLLNCEEQCQDKVKCQKRHRIKCNNGKNCYYNTNKICEFLHDEEEQEIQHMKTKDEIIKSKDIFMDTMREEIKLMKKEIDKLRDENKDILNSIKSNINSSINLEIITESQTEDINIQDI